MTRPAVSIGLIGDFAKSVPAHRAIPVALQMAASNLGVTAEPRWLATDQIRSADDLAGMHGLWCVPGSPYRNMDGALLAIQYARQSAVPFLGTCGGFQHALVEYARNVLGWRDADHAESSPNCSRPVISLLACPLVEKSGEIRLVPGTHLASAYGSLATHEMYHCRYGIHPELQAQLVSGPLRAAAYDELGDVRAVELATHPYFVATLFQFERTALHGTTPPLVTQFLRAVVR